MSELRTNAEIADNLEDYLSYYEKDAISMPEYQANLRGINEIKDFYKEIFQRQNIQDLQRKADEFIHLGSTIIEIGTFNKVYTDAYSDSLLTQHGKYWHVWEVHPENKYILKGEAFGFFHPVNSPQSLVVDLKISPSDRPEIYPAQEIPFELKAYNALMEKGVRMRDGVLRSEFFMNDAKFMPFQEPMVTGIQEIKPYLIEYSSRGEVTIDSIAVYTYHYEYLGDYILEYPKFYVKWTIPQFSGRTAGKGIRIWKRQKDKSLKLYREIGTHNLIL